MSDQREKDPMLTFKSVKHGTSSKGNKTSALSLTQEAAQLLYDSLGALLENPRGVKLSIHFTRPTTKDGREFDSAFAYISGIQEFGAYNSRQAAPTKFVRTGTTAKDRIARAKQDIKG